MIYFLIQIFHEHGTDKGKENENTIYSAFYIPEALLMRCTSKRNGKYKV